MLQCVAVCCSVLQCVAVFHTYGLICIPPRRECWQQPPRISRAVATRPILSPQLSVWCRVLQCIAVCCSVLQCVAACHRVLKCVVVCCRVLQCADATQPIICHPVSVCCNVLQRVAVFCSVLQFAAVCCSVS